MQKTILLAGIIFSRFILDTYAQPGAEAHISIDATQSVGEINPMLYGQFAEFMYENIKGGLHAELLRNRGFEEAPNAIGLSRYWERYPDDRNDDYGLAFRWDDSVAYPVSHDFFDEVPVQHALRVDVGGGVIERHGVYQPRIPVRAGITYQGYLWMKTSGYEGRVVVALEEDITGGKVYAEADIEDVEGDWKKYAFELLSSQTNGHARLAILFDGSGQLWIDQVSLMPGDAVGEVRKDVYYSDWQKILIASIFFYFYPLIAKLLLP